MFKCVGVFFILSLICVKVLSETPYESHTFTKFGSVAESKNDGDHRLPKSTVPKDYDLTLTVPLGSGVQKPEDQFKFEGKVIINLDVNEKTKTLTLHSKNLRINKGTLQKVETKPTTKSLTHTFDDKNDFLILAKTDSTDIVKGSYVLTIEFSGELSDDKFGLLRRSYTKENGEKQWLAVTNFQPDGARRAFPCFDEPAFRAKFKLTVVHSKSLSVLSNMPLYSENEVKGDRNKIKSVFEETPAMSTYTLAVIISDFVKIENNNFAVYGRSEVKKSLNLALEYGEKVIKSLEEYLGVKILDGYTKKIAQVAVPGYPSGALENWGLVFYNEQGLLYDEKMDVISKKQSVIQLVAHELAHQWFGNLVTPKWWQYLWLSKGFSDFFGSLIPDKLGSTCRAVDQSVVENIHPLLQYDSGKTVPMNQNVETHDIFKKFDAISYTKASAVIRMMQHFLTEDVFKAGLQKYLTTKKLEAADSEDLFNALQKAVDEKKFPLENSVNTIMNSWINRAGYPVVTAGRIYGSKKIRLSQERFITYTADEEGAKNTGNWHIPINFATEGNPDFKNTSASIWLEHSGIEISTNVDSDKWIILNKQQTGYYRVNYDDHNWKLIIESLKSKDIKDLDTIHVLNRAQLLDDALAFVKTGSLDVKTLLNLTSYLKNETDYIAWKSGFDVISYFNDKLANTVYHSGFKTYALDLLEKFITKAIFKGDKEADHVIEINKAKIWNWACYLGHVDCTPVMKESLLKWLDQPAKNPISRDLFDVTLCHGLREADQATWTKVFEKSIKETDEDEKAKLFNALTCSNDPDILTKFLNSTVEPKSGIDTIDVALRIRDNSHVGVDTVLEFLLNRFVAIHVKYESNDKMIYLFREIGKKITTEKQLEKLSSAVDQDIDEKIIADGKEEAKKNIEWLNNHKSAFVWGDKVAPTDNEQKPNNGFTINSASLGLVITVLLFTMNFIN